MSEHNGVLGRHVAHPLETVEFLPAPPALTHVEAVADEVTALCPVTGQPDIYRITIAYDAHGRVIESKSLKFYLWKFHQRRISCEALAATIAQELSEQLDQVVTVQARQQARGGIVLTGSAQGTPR